MSNLLLPPRQSLITTLTLITLVVCTSASSSSSSSSSTPSNSSSATDSIKSFLDDASDSFTDFIYSFSDAFLVGVGSSDQPMDNLNFEELQKAFVDMDWAYLLQHWQELLLWKIGFAVCLVVGLLFVLIMPFVGFFFCCCRCCCGSCAGRPQGKRHGGGKKLFCYGLLFILAVILTLFVMGSFIVARNINSNVKTIVSPRKDENVVSKAISSVSPAVEEVVDELKGDLRKQLKVIVDKVIAEFDNYGSKLNIEIDGDLGKADLADQLEKIGELLNSFLGAGPEIGALINGTDKIGSTSLQSAVDELVQTLNNCDASIKAECDSLKDKVVNLDAKETVKNIPKAELEKAADLIKDLAAKDLGEKIFESREFLGKIWDRIEEQVNKYKGLVVNVTSDEEKKVVDQVNDMWSKSIKPTLDSNLQMAGNLTLQIAEQSQVVQEYVDYATYAMYGISAAAGLSVLCLLTAFLAGCCSPKSSADCFMAFTGFYFIFCPLLMLLVALFYNSLGQVQVEGCSPFMNPRANQRIAADQILRDLQPGSMSIEFYISDVLYQCSQGEPMYKILKSTHLLDEQLENIKKSVDMDSLFGEVNKTISEVKQLIQESINGSLNSIDIEKYQKPILDALDAADLETVFDSVNNAVNFTDVKAELSTANLTALATGLKDAATKADAAGQAATATKLRESAAKFEDLQTKKSVENEILPIVDNMENATGELLKKRDLENTTRAVLSKITSSFNEMVSAMSSTVSSIISEFTDNVFNLVQNGINGFFKALEEDILPCTPLWTVITTVVGVPCQLLVDPFNGYWFEIGGYLSVGFVAIILAVHLAGVIRDEIRADKDEDLLFTNDRDNHVTNHHQQVTPSKNQVGTKNGVGKHGRGGGGGGRGGPDPRDQDLIAIEMRERQRYAQPPPYGADEGVYRSSDNLYNGDYRDNQGRDYGRDGHVNSGYRF